MSGRWRALKRGWLPGLLLLATAQAIAADACPTLPKDSGLQWTYVQGPDFDVCRAHAPGSDELAFGIYLGNWPDFTPARATRIGEGTVAGRHVVWYEQPGDSGAPPGRQTLLTLDEQTGLVAHVWMGAAAGQQLQKRLSALERIVFKTP